VHALAVLSLSLSLSVSQQPLQRHLYAAAPSNGSDATPSIAAAREAIASTVTNSIFHAPTTPSDGPQLGISGRRLENGRVFSGVFQIGFVCPQLKFAFGLLWDAVATKAARNHTSDEVNLRFDLATQMINEWTMQGGSGSEADGDVNCSGNVAVVNLSHSQWTHGFGPPGCCPAGTKQGDGCPIVNNMLRCSDTSQRWQGIGEWTDDNGRFGSDPEQDARHGGVVWIRRLAEGHSLVMQAVSLLQQTAGESGAAFDTSVWEAWVSAGAENLLKLQRDDGSWGRAVYRLRAKATDPPFDPTPLLDKSDTLFPVYFLADAAVFYVSTDAAKARRLLGAAVKGGEMAWLTYGKNAMYVAGDYVPSLDKEACLFALRAYLALAEAVERVAMSGADDDDAQQWVQRAADTALFCDTLHYQVNLPLAVDRPRNSPYSQWNDWARDWYEGQTTVGLGFIELGHSGVDTTGSEFVPDLLRLYERTRDAAHLNQALIQLHNTKQMLDVHGRKGYFERGFMPELWIFAVQAYQDPGGNGPPARNYNRGVGHHLNVPWPTACAMLGIARTCMTVGAARAGELTGQGFCS
jgi:hypothetical protein